MYITALQYYLIFIFNYNYYCVSLLKFITRRDVNHFELQHQSVLEAK